MRAAKADTNQREIVSALRSVGASVCSLHRVGMGCPDLMVGFRGATFLLEIKYGRGKLTPCQVVFHRDWRGHVAIVRSPEGALAAIGAVEVTKSIPVRGQIE